MPFDESLTGAGYKRTPTAPCPAVQLKLKPENGILSRVCQLVLCSLLCHCAAMQAQNAERPGPAVLPDASNPAETPPAAKGSDVNPGAKSVFLRGLNAGVNFSAVHDSSIGWYSAVTPSLSYTFSSRYSADASISLYPYRLSPDTAGTYLAAHEGDVGDTLLQAHAAFYPHRVQDIVTFATTLPTGNRDDALSIGHVTVDLSNHLQRYFGQTGALVDFGIGDSSGLFNRLIPGEDNALGPVAHAQVGFVQWMFGSNYVQTVAYEQLPIGDQKYYTTLTRPGFPDLTVPAGRKVSEDNGFTTIVGIPLTDHISLLSYYNRSLRLHLDTVSTGFTYTFRATPRVRHMSEIDKALREAEMPPR